MNIFAFYAHGYKGAAVV